MSKNLNWIDGLSLEDQMRMSVAEAEFQAEWIREAVSEATELSADYIRKIVEEELKRR